jgi:hypothetical protein
MSAGVRSLAQEAFQGSVRCGILRTVAKRRAHLEAVAGMILRQQIWHLRVYPGADVFAAHPVPEFHDVYDAVDKVASAEPA